MPAGLEPCRQHMMDEIAVDAAVAIHEGMGKDEPESKDGGCDDGIELSGLLAVEGDHAADERWQVLEAGADVDRQGHARLAVVLADEAALAPQPKAHEAVVADDDALQAQSVEIERPATGFADGPPPALDAVMPDPRPR